MSSELASGPVVVRLPRPHPGQEELLRHAARFKIAVCGRRWGKTTIGAIALLIGHGPVGEDGEPQYRGAFQGGQVAWVSPSYPMSTETWYFLKRATANTWLEKREDERWIVLPGGGRVVVRSADRPDSLRGAGYDGIVLDEFAQMPEQVWTQILRPTLADRQGWAFFIGTPRGYDNWAWRLWQLAGEMPEVWGRWQQPTHENPYIAPDEIVAMAQDMSPVAYAQEVLAEFVSAAGNLIRREWWQRYEKPPRGMRVEIFVDAAYKQGVTNDYSVIATWGTTGGKYYVLDVWRKRATMPELLDAIVAQVRNAAKRYHTQPIVVVEDAAAGQSVIQALRWGLPGVSAPIPVVAWPEKLAHDPDYRRLRLANKVARLEGVLPLLEGGLVFVPTDAPWVQDFIEEHAAFHPESKAHDDQVDTTIMALWRLSRGSGAKHRVVPYRRELVIAPQW